MKMIMKTLNSIKKNRGGFTLIELVMTILLIGILSIGLYQVVMWGINDYMTNEQYLHSNNSMTQAMATIRRNLENAAMPTAAISPSGTYYCKLSNLINPATTSTPIVTANMAGQTTACSTTCEVTGQPVCDEAAFYQNISGTTNQQLVVFCVYNNILYKEVTTNGAVTASYPIANNISCISF
jgi:prepilin-type N-terminal cleavage/methylation domain-containing protein